MIKLWLILIRLTLSGTLNDILFVAFRFYMDILFALNTSICILELLLWPIMMFLMSSSLNKESQSFLSFCKMLENIFMPFFKMKFLLICKWHSAIKFVSVMSKRIQGTYYLEKCFISISYVNAKYFAIVICMGDYPTFYNSD